MIAEGQIYEVIDTLMCYDPTRYVRVCGVAGGKVVIRDCWRSGEFVRGSRRQRKEPRWFYFDGRSHQHHRMGYMLIESMHPGDPATQSAKAVTAARSAFGKVESRYYIARNALHLAPAKQKTAARAAADRLHEEWIAAARVLEQLEAEQAALAAALSGATG